MNTISTLLQHKLKSLHKRFLLSVALLTMCTVGVSQLFVIGTGTSTNTTTTYPAPYGQWYNGSKHQMLILASEFTSSGVTTERMFQNMGFNISAVAGASLTNLTIKMGMTSATSLSTTFVTGLTQVYTTSSYTSVVGWNTHSFSTPFVWDGTSNIVIEVCFDNYPNGYTTNALHYYSTTSFNSCNYYYSDGGGVCPTAIASTVATTRPNMRFTITTPVPYDILTTSIVSPTSWAVGNNTLTIRASNFGTTAITSADFGYIFNNGTPVLENAVAISPARTTGQTYDKTFTTALNITTGGTYTLKVWSRNPNNTGPDGNVNNDTLTVSICTGMSGSFTINPSGTGANNYVSFTAVGAALNSCGISGPCYFTVAAGTYTEKLTLTNINGTSATNTITFDGVDSVTRILTYNETAGVSAVINLIGTSYVTIKNLRIINTGGTYGSGVNIQSGSNYNTIKNCRINVAVNAATSNIYGVGICGASYSSSSTGANNTITNCKIVGGYAGVDLFGTSSTVFTNGNSVIACNISLCYLYGIFDYYQNLNTITDNRVFLTSGTNTYGIYSYYCQNNIIDRNIIVAAYMGLYIYNNNNLGTQRMSCSNNIVNMNGPYTYSTNYGMYALYNVNGDFKHNTIYTAPSVASGYASYLGYGSGCIFKNNIFQSNNASMYAVYCPSITFTSFDYNIMYAPGTNYVYWGGAYANLTSLKAAAPLFHQNSLFKVANFASLANQAEDLHLSSASPSDVAEIASALTVDVDNEPRCMLAPSIGADDSKYGAGTLTANYTTPDSVFINSPTTFANYMPFATPSYKQWYVNGILVAATHDLIYTFTASGTYNLKLVMIGCFQTDSITKSITVYNLTQKPIANFISDINAISTNQNVSFKDLTTKGPSYWQWIVTPTFGVSFINGTSSNSQHPVMNFANAGSYTVCLWDSNALGRSNTLCKVSYIFVEADVIMCAAPFNTKVSSGSIYDDGGPSGNYSANKTCSFLIDPCASSVSLTFTSFSLASGSFLRVYDGIDNTGAALHTGTGFTGIGLPPVLTASSGKMYIEFVSGATTGVGFAASWTSIAGSYLPPSGKINAPDTADDCGSLNTFSFASNDAFFNKDAADYTWYFTNNVSPTFSSKGLYTVQYGFTTSGVYPIRLDVNGCGGVSTFYDTVRVITPTTAPLVDFIASATHATITDVITLTDISKYGTTSRVWTITGPGAVTKITGDSSTSIFGIKLTTPGIYTVMLSGTNCIGTNQLTKTGYITVFNYCTPVVSNLNVDFAIQNVTFGRIDTIINGEITGFDYTNVTPALGTVSYRDNTNKIKNYSFGTKAVEAIADVGGTYNFSVTRYGILNTASINIWIDYNQNGVFQSSELVASSGVLTGKTFTGSITIPASATLGVTRMRIGTSVAFQNNLPCGANMYGDFNDYRIKITPDLSAPAIEFNGSDTIYVEIGRVFIDPGYTVVDNITNPCPNTVTGITSGTQITSHPFTSSYTVTATDAAGNVSTRTRTVKSSPDITKPIITMSGSSTVTLAVGTTYTDAGATALDFFFGSLTSAIVSTSTVNTSVTDTYTVTYNVIDASGNAADAVVRTVIINDTQKPVITVSGTNPLYVEALSSFTAPAATVTDNYCTGLTYTVTGLVNTNVLGTYTLTYNATDCSGNDALPVSLSVIVRDTKAPSLMFILGDTLILDVNTLTVVPEPGYILNDNYYNAGALTLNVNYSNVKLNLVGNYPVRYYISDPSGNTDSSHIRVYRIVDRGAPMITLIGDEFLLWKRWTPYVDPGTTVTDNYYTGLVSIADLSKVNIYLDGVYTVTYNLTDPSGNKALEAIRYVKVYTEANGINSSANTGSISIYPNPNNGIFNFDINMTDVSFINIVIFDANGKQVYSNIDMKPIDNYKMQIDLSKEAPGMYFVKVLTDKVSMTRSFAIQK
jgi:PKD repeat protein